ncbi:MAG: ammonium transporter [Planctomycetota bacterium]|nr:ammonium transporter [Planctomycetota bacterium]MDA1251756.1 ammonium transporter [Planctomycetota bacterium]
MFSKVRLWLFAAMMTMTMMAVPFSSAIAQDAEVEATPVGAADGSDGEAMPDGEDQGDAEAPAPEAAASAKIVYDPRFVVDNLWVMIAGMLVFIMHLGFATLESGLTRSKNTVNILFKNTMIICIGLLTYGIMGFNLMYPGFADGTGDEVIGFAGFGFLSQGTDILNDASKMTKEGYALDMTHYTDFFFQAMFAATCCTIVSGAVAGRIKLSSFLIFATLFVTFSYPITGSWKWGYGWLHDLGFYDFAGSTLVHSVGGWGALVMAILLGPRKGKYVDGEVKAMPASSLPLAAIGVFLLWFGWFGFNGGSVLSADPGKVSLVLVTTTMAAAAGGFSAAMTSWAHSSKPDLSMALNGILAGLVGITAGADLMTGLDAILIGLIAGVLVYFTVIFVDTKLKIDDPVGAISVHLVCGIWGTLCVGLFGANAGMEQLKDQLTGIVAIGAFTVVFCLIVGLALKSTVGLRVSPEEEEKGLDIGEHGMQAYAH